MCIIFKTTDSQDTFLEIYSCEYGLNPDILF